MIRILIIILFLNVSLPAKEKLDSLVDILETVREDSSRVKVMFQIAQEYRSLDTAIARDYANRAYEFCKLRGHGPGMYRAKKLLGNINCDNFDYDAAVEDWLEAHMQAKELNDNEMILESYEKLGEIYQTKGDYDKATNFFISGLGFANKNAMIKGAARMNISLGKLNYFLENYDQSLMYLSNSLKTYLSLEDYFSIAVIRLEMGKVHLGMGDEEKAYEDLFAASKLSDHIKETKELALIYRYMGNVLYLKSKFKESLDYLISAYSLALTFKDDKLLAEINYDLGKLFNLRGEYLDAIKHFLDGLLHVQISGEKPIELAIYKELAMAYEKNQDYENAYKTQQMYIDLREELFSVDKTKLITNAMTKYQSEKVQQENEILQKKVQIEQLERQKDKYVIFTIIGLALVLLLFAVIFYLRNKQKQRINEALERKNEQIERQKGQLEELNQELTNRNEEIEEINENLIRSSNELKELNATKDKFFSIIAHDLKNPISGFMVSSDLLVNYYERLDKDQVLSKITDLNKASKHLRDLLENLLNWSRTQTGSIDYEPEQIALSEIIERITGLLKTSADNKHINLNVDIDDAINLVVDPKMIETVIRNLVSNAIKFTPENGNINLNAEIKDDTVFVSVKDDGVGIPEDKIDNLFDITRNFTTLGTNEEKGTGLGLILCKEFVEANKGQIKVSSELGKGTKFSISLPGCLS